jgi:hypothetical protein
LDRGTRRPGDQPRWLISGTSTSASVHESDRVAYEVHYSRWFGGLGLKTIGGRFRGFGPQNPGGGSEEEQTTRGGIEEFVSRRNYLMKGAVAVG